MIKYILVATILLFGLKDSMGQPKSGIKEPVSDFGHIDIIVDSATWYAIKNDSFIQNHFGVLDMDTAHYGSLASYDLYVLGQLNFLHISLAKDFWANQTGGGVLVFQTLKPGQIEPLLKSWKLFFPDSLFVHSFKGFDFTLHEIFAWYKKDSTKPQEPRLFANLTTYSTDAYNNWGITDSMVNAGTVMQQFMSSWGGDHIKNRLFNSITELHMTIGHQEYKEIKSALFATGYTENKNIFSRPMCPRIYVTISEEKGKSKYSVVKFKLNGSVSDREIVLSKNVTLKLNNDEGWLILR